MKPREASCQMLEARTLLSDYNYFDLANSTLPQGDVYESDEISLNLHVVDTEYDPQWDPQVWLNFGEWDDGFSNTSGEVRILGTEQDVPVHHVYADNTFFSADLYLYDLADHYEFSVYNRQPDGWATYDTGDESGEDLTVYTLSGTDVSPTDMASGLRYSFAYRYANLAPSYMIASYDTSFAYDPDLDDDGILYGRVFDKDGDYTDVRINAPMFPTINWDQVHHNLIQFSWNTSITNGQEQHWLVQRARDVAGHPGTWSTIATLDAGSDHYPDSDVSPGTRYWYRVRAQGTPGTEGDTLYSAKRAMTTPLQAPTPGRPGVDRPYGTQTVNLDWPDIPGATFSAYRGLYDGFSIAGLNPFYTGSTSACSDTSTKSPKAAYFYRVVASITGEDDSDPSNAAPAFLPGCPPTGLEAYATTSNKVNLYWNPEPDVYFNVYRSTSPTFASYTQVGSAVVNVSLGNPWPDTTVSSDTPYYYKVTSVWNGHTMAESDLSSVASADTTDPYSAPIVSFDDALLVDTTYAVDVSGSSGVYEIPIFTSHGRLISASLSVPDNNNPFVDGRDYDFGNPTTKTGYLNFHAMRDGPFVVALVRQRGDETFVEGIEVFLNSACGDGERQPVPPGFRQIAEPNTDVIFVSTATGIRDNGFLSRVRTVLDSAGGPGYVSMSSVDGVVGDLINWEESNPNGTLSSITIIDHGGGLYEQGGWIGMGCGRGQGDAGTYLTYAGSGPTDEYVNRFTEELHHLRKYHGLDKVTFYECHVAKISFGQPLLKKISELSRKDPVTGQNDLSSGVQVIGYGGEVNVTSGTWSTASWYVAKNDNPWTWRDPQP
jgi:hypothetical protein